MVYMIHQKEKTGSRWKPVMYASPVLHWPLVDYIGRPHWVYAVYVEKLEFIKIGTTGDLCNRLNGLRSQFKSDVQILGVFCGSLKEEQETLLKLSPSLADLEYPSRELFYPTTEVLNFIKQNMKNPQDVYAGEMPYPIGPLKKRHQFTISTANYYADYLLKGKERYFEFEPKKRIIEFQNRIRKASINGDDIQLPIKYLKLRMQAILHRRDISLLMSAVF